jgi:hypothetical protein
MITSPDAPGGVSHRLSGFQHELQTVPLAVPPETAPFEGLFGSQKNEFALRTALVPSGI